MPPPGSPPRRLAAVALLLTLLLYLSGGVLAAGHLHLEESGAVDHACVVCTLASTATGVAAAALLFALRRAISAAPPTGTGLASVQTHRPLPPARAPPPSLLN